MVESPPQKKDEQYPLLLVTGGAGGDVASKRSAPRAIPVLSSVWNVTSCNPKRPWFDRVPEFVSTCWMTFILLGISFLVFYAIGMVTYKKEPFVIFKNNSKPFSDVYLHHMFPRDSHVPFTAYSEYIASLAIKYPYLRFNVIFLLEDSPQNDYPVSKHARFYAKLLPYQTTKLYDEYSKREMTIFQKRYQNVVINIFPISKYMAKTPLKYKWKIIPKAFIPFYARVFSIWQTGGVALDLYNYNQQYRRSRSLDLRLDAILKQHNNGINIADYINALNAIHRNEETEFFLTFNNMINRLINDTRSFFNLSLPFTSIGNNASEEEPLVRTHRNKRDLEQTTNISSNDEPIINLVLENTTVAVTDDAKENVYHIDTDTNATSNISMPEISNQVSFMQTQNADVFDADFAEINKTDNNNNNSLPIPGHGHIVMIYDLSIISDGDLPQPRQPTPFERVPRRDSMTKHTKFGPHQSQIVSIESEGSFISATSAMHPFLGYIMSGGYKLMPPKIAIQDALISQCAGELRDGTYCDNIFIL